MINRNLRDGDPHTVFQIGDVPDDYCEQLLSEQLKRQGNTTRWVKVGQTRNEALDCTAYSMLLLVMYSIKCHGKNSKPSKIV